MTEEFFSFTESARPEHILKAEQLAFLRDLFPGEESLFRPEETLVYGSDASRLFAPAQAVLRPKSQEQIVKLLRWAQAEGVPVFPRGRATGVVGGSVPKGGGVVVSTLNLDRIIDISAEDFVAVAQPGVITGDLQKKLEAQGLFYPPDPASAAHSSIGGNISTNAGGMRALKYGVTSNHVLGLTAVLPGGKVLKTGGRCHKDVVGLDMTRLFTGSEGTLGIITEIILKLQPKPEATATAAAGFASMDEAFAAIRAVFAAGLLPAAMEFMAEKVLRCIEKNGHVPWPKETESLLLIRLDGTKEAVSADLERLVATLQKGNAGFLEQGRGPEEEEPIWELRKLMNPASYAVAPDKMSNDVVVPRGSIPEAAERIEAAAEEEGLTVLVFGHVGDGNLHVNVMYDEAEGQKPKARRIMEKVADIVLSLGGSMSGEHGVGLTKLSILDRQLDPIEREMMQALKKTFDPKGIMNPGKAY
jgi:D-lactate dehydrogenase (cytochrome)/glycolate oxidase